MARPTTTAVNLRPDLTMGLQEFDLAADRLGFIAPRLMPVFEVARKSGDFPRIKLESLLTSRKTRRAPRSGYSRSEWEFEDDNYNTYEEGAEELLDENEAATYGDFFDYEVIMRDRARDALLRNHEIEVAALAFNASVVGTATGVSVEWSTAATATPITDIKAAKRRAFNRTGIWPNALVISYAVWQNLQDTAQVIDRIQSGGAGDRTTRADLDVAAMARVLDVRHLLVGGAAKNTAAQGLDAAVSEIWDDEFALVTKIAETNDLAEPCFGRTMHWAGDGSQIGGTIEQYEEPEVRGDVLRARRQVGLKVMYPECSDLLSNITA